MLSNINLRMFLPAKEKTTFLYIALLIVGIAVFILGTRIASTMLESVGIIVIIVSFMLLFIMPFVRKFLSGPKVDLDLVYSLLHMRLVASGKNPAGKVLGSVSDPSLYGIYSKTFAKAVVLAREWGYNLSEALSYIAKNITEKAFKEVVQRLALTIKLGADLETFLETEYNTLAHEYEFQYQRSLNNMRVLLGVYVATLAALVFALANFMLLSFFFFGSHTILLQAYIAGITMVIVLGGLIVFFLPKKVFDIKGRHARENRLVRLIDLTSGLATALAIVLPALYLRGKPIDALTLGIAVTLAGIPMLVPGIIALMYESRVNNVDTFFPVFIRSLGSFISTIPSLKHAISQVLRADLGGLSKLIYRFHSRLENEIPPDIVWKRFAIESGSELVRRGSRIFQDTIEYGGDTELAGKAISDHNNMLLGLRRLRNQIASNFTSTTIVIHSTVVAISMFVLGLITYFNEVLMQLTSQLTPEVAGYIFIQPVNIEFLNKTIYAFVVMLTIINSYLIAKVRPFSQRSFWIYLGIMLITTGVSAYLSSRAVDYVLQTMASVSLPELGV
ncbi:MAG: type II secretion system F family protein [Desulfurococcales archaeon]|nr:type II secretion system F family protein [Desulfurococcales archaeon]